MNSLRIQQFCIVSAPVATIIYIIAFVGIAGFVPPTEPTMNLDSLVEMYNNNRNWIRTGNLIGMVVSILYLPWYAILAVHMARIEGRMPVLSIVQFAGGLILVVYFIFCGMLWNVAAYRPELAPEQLLLVHDASWLFFVMVYPEYSLQLICIAVVGFMDKRAQPLFPRWLCYFNLWVAVSAVGGGFATFFKEGAFAYNGLFGFWVPVAFFLMWLAIMVPVMWRGVARIAEEDARLDAAQ